ncbi:uncharacterized protein LOC129877550 isoform X2 [Solanum dulcamara]|uniref:uncharacterized protein LOC129877550 isoform X2 n=1 Tax=Solanum dulcamara TaxID=45834 RepID=UPI0024868D20|nr:uncharacterized protein LOC129877550 isoform X2 [Solanum dulcamara]
MMQACKAKYEDLQKRYYDCNAWFEELRKRRVDELKRELEKSESSIGSLVTKIESLKAEKELSAQIDYGSSRTESPAALGKLECMESIGKDYGISVGSFTLDSTRTDFESHAVASAKEIDSELECSVTIAASKDIRSCEQDEVPSISKPSETVEGNGGALRKRKRKDAVSDVKGSIGESDHVCSISDISASNCKETSTSSDQSIKPTATEDSKGGLSRLMDNDVMAIFDSIIQNEAAMVFRHRRDSQKRYKEMIKQHMDIETVRSRLVSCSIKSPGELYRDLLLLATNAIVFYAKRTREYKSAMVLRDSVTKAYHDHYKSCSYHTVASSLLTFSTTGNLPVKPRSTRPRPSKFKLQSNSYNNVNSIAEALGGDDHKPSNADFETRLQSLFVAMKGYKGHRKFDGGSVDGYVNRRTKVPGKEDDLKLRLRRTISLRW